MENKAFVTIKKSSDFQRLQKNGKRKYVSQWLIINHIQNNQNILRCGWTIPKKVGVAVVRNKLKRWCREYFRRPDVSQKLAGNDINIVIRAVKSDGAYFKRISIDEFRASLEKGLRSIT